MQWACVVVDPSGPPSSHPQGEPAGGPISGTGALIGRTGPASALRRSPFGYDYDIGTPLWLSHCQPTVSPLAGTLPGGLEVCPDKKHKSLPSFLLEPSVLFRAPDHGHQRALACG